MHSAQFYVYKGALGTIALCVVDACIKYTILCIYRLSDQTILLNIPLQLWTSINIAIINYACLIILLSNTSQIKIF